MYSIKIPLEALERKQEETTDSPEWVESCIEICRKNLPESGGSNEGNDNDAPGHSSVMLNEDDACHMRNLIDDLLENQNAD